MTDFFTIHGYPVDVASMKADQEIIGEDRARTLGAKLKSTRIGRKGNWDVELTPLEPADAVPLMVLLRDEGHVCSFDADKYSSTGLGPDAGGAGTIQSTNKKFGANALQIASTAASEVYTTGYTGDKTVMMWRRSSTDSTSFKHWAMTMTASGTQQGYKDGATATLNAWMILTTGGVLTLKAKRDDGTTDLTVQYDDLVILPCLLTAAMIASFAAATRAWADRPALNVSGAFLDDPAGAGYVEVFTDLGKIEFLQAVGAAGTWVQNFRKIPFTMRQA